MTVVSIIIPCYNTSSTLDDTLDSVFKQKFTDWEAIIVNDGSPDDLESIALKWTNRDQRFKYFKKDNGGLGSARNFGIRNSLGDYILPLDSDNKLCELFIENALKILEYDTNVGVVYSDLKLFGEKDKKLIVGEFDKFKLLIENYIDACAIIRKKVFDDIGFYDENMPFQGHEDWEYWIRVLGTNTCFYYLKEIGFEYRVNKNSMLRSFNKEMKDANVKYILSKHHSIYRKEFDNLYHQNILLKKQSDLVFPLKKVFKKIKQLVK